MAYVKTIENSQEVVFTSIEDGRFECLVCPHRCKLRNGQSGICQVREASDGIYLKGYGKISHAAVEPIEKKPIYHYKPNLKTLSIGGFGCSFSCNYCQNWMVSQANVSNDSSTLLPKEAVDLAKNKNCEAICFTYNEPIVYFEYVVDLWKECKKTNLDLILKTNAYAEPSIWKVFCSIASAMNIDWKGNQQRYRQVAKADEKPVLDCIEAAIGKTHIEISIPIYADSSIDEHRDFANFIGRYPDVPLHLLKIYPAYKDIACPVTSDFLIRKIGKLYSEKSNYIYLQNIYDVKGQQDTLCPVCKSIVAARESLTTIIYKDSCCNCPIIKYE